MRESFVLQGTISGFFSSPRVVLLQVHGDGTLSGSVSTNEAEDEQNGDFETFLILHGSAVQVKQDSDSCAKARAHNVQFQLAKRTDIPGLVYVIVIEGKLSSSAGLQGRWWFEADTSGANARKFDLPIQRHGLGPSLAVGDKPPAHALSPLTQGSYKLKGAAVGDNGYLYQATWSLELCEGGVLRGSSTEYDNAPQVSRVEGSWNSGGIDCTLFYEVDGVVGSYTYNGDAHHAALRGRWVNSDAPDSAQERGKFEFVVVEARRRWNHCDHKHYPKNFRDVVRLCLLSSIQSSEVAGDSNGAAPRIPSILWSEVFSYCGFDWFPAATPPQ